MPPPTKAPDQFLHDLEDLLLAHGISSLTMGEMAQRLSCSRRRLYELAPTKEGIFLMVAEGFFHAIREAGGRQAADYSSPPDKLQAYFAFGTAEAGRITPHFLRDLEATEAGRKLFDKHQRLRVQGMEEIIIDGVAQGVFAPCNARFVAEVVYLVCKQLRDEEFQSRAGTSLDGGFEALHHLVLHGLLHGPPVKVSSARRPSKAPAPHPKKSRRAYRGD
jgi:AcrR family transcriptional regulator